MPAAPSRARPAGAARSSPSAPRGRVRGSRAGGGTADHRERLRVARIALVLALGLATVKLVAVQGPQSGTLQASSSRQRTTEIALPAERGTILDRAGAPLAFSLESRALVANPRLIAATHGDGAAAYVSEMAAAVAQATGADATVVRQQLASRRGYVVLIPLVDPEIARALHERFPEIAEEKRESRQYPGGPLAANVVGVASWNSSDQKLGGLMGLESSQDNLLAGTDGLRVVDTAEGSAAVIPGSTRFERPATPGSDLQLTLDSDLQYTAQRQAGRLRRRAGRQGRLGRGPRRRAPGEVLAHRQRPDVRSPQRRRRRRVGPRQRRGVEPVRAGVGQQGRHDRRGAGVSDGDPGPGIHRARAASRSPTAR